jgi:hypothetical protein
MREYSLRGSGTGCGVGELTETILFTYFTGTVRISVP